MRGPYISVSESVVCPIPRRIGISVNDHTGPSRFQFSRQTELFDSKAGTERLDMILTDEGNCGAGKPNSIQVTSSPPFFSGSPPSRASNPQIQDSQFCNKLCPLSPKYPSSSARQGGAFARMKFGQKPAAVRIEGFDSLSSDRQNCGISAVA